MTHNSVERRRLAKGANPSGRFTVGQGLGCIFAMIAIPALGVAAVFYFAGLYVKEWEDARPAKMSASEWAEKRSLCVEATLAAPACAATPTAEVRRIGTELATKRMRELCARDDHGAAIQKAQQAVSAQLRAPSTAQFGVDIRASHKGCDWLISGEVDAQNAFGGTVRSAFSVRLRRTSEDVWERLKVSVR